MPVVPRGWDIGPTSPMGPSPCPSWNARSHGHLHEGRSLYIHTYIHRTKAATAAAAIVATMYSLLAILHSFHLHDILSILKYLVARSNVPGRRTTWGWLNSILVYPYAARHFALHSHFARIQRMSRLVKVLAKYRKSIFLHQNEAESGS